MIKYLYEFGSENDFFYNSVKLNELTISLKGLVTFCVSSEHLCMIMFIVATMSTKAITY